MNIKLLQKYYCGFEITEPFGNNAFSFEQRHNKSIFVPPLIEGNLSDLQLGKKIVFSEVEDGVEKNRSGLKNFIYFKHRQKDIFIFDNHNHAFFFWLAGFTEGKIKEKIPLIHVDQHSDMRKPEKYPEFNLNDYSMEQVFAYTNFDLNVGNFIQPAIELGLFSDVKIIDSTTSFAEEIPNQFVLDLDLDVFSEEMAYIDESYKIKRIKEYISNSKFITIATSPYFIDQNKVLLILKKLFE